MTDTSSRETTRMPQGRKRPKYPSDLKQAEYSAKWRAANLKVARAPGRAYRLRLTAWLRAFKDRPCMDCGGNFPPECMDWDHVRGHKLFTVGTSTMNKTAAVKEMAKCDLVCTNCHRIRTTRRLRERKKAK